MLRHIRVVISAISPGSRVRGGIPLGFVVLSVRRVLLAVAICSSSLASGGLGFAGLATSFDCTFRHFDNFTSSSLFSASTLRKSSVDRCERSKHGFVQLSLLGVDGSSVLTKIVEPGECFATMTRERTFTGMFSVFV